MGVDSIGLLPSGEGRHFVLVRRDIYSDMDLLSCKQPKLSLLDSQSSLSTVLVSHTVLRLIKELTLQQKKSSNRTWLMELPGLAVLLIITKSLA